MNIFESLKMALKALWINKMRSLLTMLGIIIGVSSVIAVVAIGNGGQSAIGKEFENFGVNRVFIYHNWREELSQREFMRQEDYDAIKRIFKDEISALSPSSSQQGTIVTKTREKKPITARLTGCNEDFNKIEKMDIGNGRFLIENDIKSGKYSVVIDSKLAQRVFGRTGVVGEKITINAFSQNLTFLIVGVYDKPKSLLSGMGGGEETTDMYVPIKVMNRLSGNGDYIFELQANISTESNVEEVCDKIVNILARRHKTEVKKYQYYSAESEMNTVNKVTGIMKAIVSAIAAISLLVGGIGVMNIMLVSVTERTREIGIRKALGAKHKDILLQFLVESVIISFTGGIIGTLIGVGLSLLISVVIKIPPNVSLSTIGIAWLFSAGLGIFFGLYPANKAAKLDPIDALRYE